MAEEIESLRPSVVLLHFTADHSRYSLNVKRCGPPLAWSSIGMVLPQILQCVAVNLILVYALLAYSGIKKKDFANILVCSLSLL